MKIKAVVFDLWETLGTKNVGVGKPLQAHFGIPKTDDFLKRYERSVQLRAWSSEDEMAKSFLAEFGVPQSQENVVFVVNCFREGIARATLFDGMRDLLGELKAKGLKLGLLSNTTVFESVALDNLKISEFFDETVFSWQIGQLKPWPEAFESIFSKMGCPNHDVFFTDDGEANVEAAQSLGALAAVFKGVEPLRQTMAELEII